MFKRGSHDRIVYSLGLGAAIFTDAAPWVVEQFPEGHGLFTYSSNSPASAAAQAIQLLQKKDALHRAIHNGQELILRKHTWDCRAEELLTSLSTELELLQETL
jgi:hypothetical protein